MWGGGGGGAPQNPNIFSLDLQKYTVPNLSVLRSISHLLSRKRTNLSALLLEVMISVGPAFTHPSWWGKEGKKNLV